VNLLTYGTTTTKITRQEHNIWNLPKNKY
jgi:hypothetical protein